MSQSLSRALDILVWLQDGPLPTSELASRLDVHPTTALRLLQMLDDRRFVVKEDKSYSLGPTLATLGYSMLSSLDLRTIARPHLEKLGGIVGETVHLGVIDAGDVLYLDKVESVHPVRMYSQIGKRGPIHATGVGKAVLAFSREAMNELVAKNEPFHRYTDKTLVTIAELEEASAAARQRGFAVDDQEHEPMINCIAAPIRDISGRILGAVSVTAPTYRCDTEKLIEIAPQLLRTAADIERAHGVR